MALASGMDAGELGHLIAIWLAVGGEIAVDSGLRRLKGILTKGVG